tara:strand:- start:3086 stop:4879 length:1794 start_codon:yes stop_codon:yes gene_type:complete
MGLMDVYNKDERAKLLKCIEYSTRNLRPFRELRKRLVKDYVGTYYNQGGDEANSEIIMNLMYQTAETYTMSLAANRPRVLVTSKFAELSWFAHHFQRSINNLIEEIHLEETLRKAVLEAFFGMGVVKVYTAESGLIKLEGEDEWVDPGKPYAENISLDDFVYDIEATSWNKIRYALNKYKMPKYKALQDDSFDQDVVKNMQPYSNESGMMDHQPDKPLRDSFTGESKPDPYEEQLELMDVWLPYEGIVATFPVGKQSAPLRVVEWDGPENGPFHILTLCAEVPDQIMGVSPAMNLKPLNDIINGLLRKQKRQAQRQKDIPFYQDGAHEDAQRLQRAGDGEWTRVSNPESVNVLKMGGVDQQNQAFSMAMQEQFDRMAGNLQMMAGLGPQSETATQDKLIHGAVSKREANMQYRVVDFTANICKDLGWLLWTDQATEIETSYQVAGRDYRTTWSPEMREGDFLQYNFDIEPYSMMYKSPSEKLNNITQFVTQIAMPMQQNMMEAGGQIDFQELCFLYSELLDIPRLKEVITFSEPKSNRPKPNPAEPPQPQKVVKENVRRSVPTGGTRDSRSHVMQQILQGGQPNQQQMAQMGRTPAG